MMGELIQCELNRLPSGAESFDASECVDYLLAGLRRPVHRPETVRQWVPPADIAETEKHYRITLEAPGIDMKSLDITFENHMLNVRGDKYKESELGECCHCSERYNGRFERNFQITGPVDPDQIDAVYKDGILKLTLPKAEKRQVRRIEVH